MDVFQGAVFEVFATAFENLNSGPLKLDSVYFLLVSAELVEAQSSVSYICPQLSDELLLLKVEYLVESASNLNQL